MTPKERYQHQLSQQEIVADASQALAVDRLQALYEQLLEAPAPALGTLSRWWQAWRKQLPKPVRGLYFYGGVGRGKTYLMDLFFNSLPIQAKWRSHFHRFMREVHQRRTALGDRQDPLNDIARAFADQYRIICFDEFLVNDIADAMILGRLLQCLYSYGVTVVSTSNVAPQDLYRDGFQRDRFLPAIDAIVAHNEVVNVDGGVDYRLRALTQANTYYVPADAVAERALQQLFAQLATGPISEQHVLTLDARPVVARRHADGVVWFDFAALCAGPRGAADYIELAQCYPALILTNVPQMSADRDDQARRFITLVDELYDRRVDLIISADVACDQLYTGSRLNFEFQRTQSRLLEMQTAEYLALPHST